MVQAGRPIVSLCRRGTCKVRFFVPQAVLPQVHIGDRVAHQLRRLRARTSSARVSFISAQAEFTPPIIYSQEERARLVFRIEAMPEQPEDLRVGQPVSVVLVQLQPPRRSSHAASDDKRDKAGEPSPIEVEGLTKSFGGKVVVRDLSMRVRARRRSTASSAPTARARPPRCACCAAC